MISALDVKENIKVIGYTTGKADLVNKNIKKNFNLSENPLTAIKILNSNLTKNFAFLCGDFKGVLYLIKEKVEKLNLPDSIVSISCNNKMAYVLTCANLYEIDVSDFKVKREIKIKSGKKVSANDEFIGVSGLDILLLKDFKKVEEFKGDSMALWNNKDVDIFCLAIAIENRLKIIQKDEEDNFYAIEKDLQEKIFNVEISEEKGFIVCELENDFKAFSVKNQEICEEKIE